MTLSYPLDVTSCQNDKLLFIADPVVEGTGGSARRATV
jgi:hypothetical protein